MRAAVYFTPAADHPLTRVACEWLGRDAFSGEPVQLVESLPLSRAEVRALVAEPRRYGFHATLKAPFRLRDGVLLADLRDAVRLLAGSACSVGIASLRLEQLGEFFALAPSGRSGELESLAARVVTELDGLRAELTSAEIARRRPDTLTARQRGHLRRWGYPHVLGDFQFHMTLTGPVPAGRGEAVRAVLTQKFAACIGGPLDVDALCLFIESESGADFLVDSRYPCRAKT